MAVAADLVPTTNEQDEEINSNIPDADPECQEKLGQCVDIAKRLVQEANEYIAKLNEELETSSKLNAALGKGLNEARAAYEDQKRSSKNKATIIAIVGGAAAGALLSTQQKEFSMLSGALAGGLVSGGTAALLTSVVEF